MMPIDRFGREPAGRRDSDPGRYERATLMATAHRADYILEHGVWRGICRFCAFEVTDEDRRRATSKFRLHIREASEWDRVSVTGYLGTETAVL